MGHDYYITICVAMTLFEAKHVSPNFIINLWNCVELFNLYFIVYVTYFAVICPIVDAQNDKRGKRVSNVCWVHPNEQKFVSYNQLTIGINLSSITNDPNVWRQHTILHIIFTFELWFTFDLCFVSNKMLLEFDSLCAQLVRVNQ